MNEFDKFSNNPPESPSSSPVVGQRIRLVGVILTALGTLWLFAWSRHSIEFLFSDFELPFWYFLSMHVSLISNGLLLAGGIQLLRQKPIGYNLAMVAIFEHLGWLVITHIYTIMTGGGALFSIFKNIGLQFPVTSGSLTRLAIFGGCIAAIALLNGYQVHQSLDPTGSRRRYAIILGLTFLIYGTLCYVIADLMH